MSPFRAMTTASAAGIAASAMTAGAAILAQANSIQSRSTLGPQRWRPIIYSTSNATTLHLRKRGAARPLLQSAVDQIDS